MAALFNCIEAFEVLIEAGADTSLKNEDDIAILEFAPDENREKFQAIMEKSSHLIDKNADEKETLEGLISLKASDKKENTDLTIKSNSEQNKKRKNDNDDNNNKRNRLKR